MNILELCLSTSLGGLELYFHRCSAELSALGMNVLSARYPRSRLFDLARSNGISVAALSRRNSGFPLFSALRLSRIIRKQRIDIVHAHLKDDLPLCALTKRICKRPFKLVFTRHMQLSEKKHDIYHRWLYSPIDLFIVTTRQMKRDALDFLPLPAERIVLLYCGVSAPPPHDQDFLRRFLNISQPGDFSIGVFSRVEFQKGQHLAIEAVHLLRKKNIPAKLYLAGTVMDEAYKESLVQRVAELELGAHVAFKGFVDKPVEAMQGMNIVVLPSRGETFGLTLIEAMRCGIPVVGANAGGVPEIIDDRTTGLLFEWGRHDQLADRLEYLYRDAGARNEIASSGKRKADALFSSEVHFQTLKGLLNRLGPE